jgi:hypothetical protein
MKTDFAGKHIFSIFWTLLFLAQITFLPTQIHAQKPRQLVQTDNSEKRTALVIGNGNYKHTSVLANPVNDATDVANALKSIGFEVISGTNQTKRGMETLIREFGDKLLKQGGVGLFYYAGHGIQVGGKNYLIPVDAEIPEEDEIGYAAVPIDFVLTKMESADNAVNLLILDACRNNPFSRSWRNFRDIGDSNGLAKISPPTGTLVLYATEPGNVASDGTGRNGLFTSALLNNIKKPKLEYDRLVKQISTEVWEKSNKKQLPWKEGNSLVDFYFVQGDKTAANVEIEKPPTNLSEPNTFGTNQTSTVKKLQPANGVKLEEVQVNFKSNLFTEAIEKGKLYLENDPENAEVNAMVGYSLLTKSDVEQSLQYLSKAILGGQSVTLPVKRGRPGLLNLGHQLADVTITISKDKLAIQEGDKFFTGNMSDLGVSLGNYLNQCPTVSAKGKFTETRLKSQKSKGEDSKEFVLFPLSATLIKTKKDNVDIELISCNDNGMLPTAIVKLINIVKIGQ